VGGPQTDIPARNSTWGRPQHAIPPVITSGGPQLTNSFVMARGGTHQLTIPSVIVSGPPNQLTITFLLVRGAAALNKIHRHVILNRGPSRLAIPLLIASGGHLNLESPRDCKRGPQELTIPPVIVSAVLNLQSHPL
jgi:hypothetical protein